MKFDITKVVYSKDNNELSYNIKIGTKGYCADKIENLKFNVENECINFYDELRDVDTNSIYPFRFVNHVEAFALFYPVEEKKYRPYTWEEREQLRGKWIKREINGKSKEEFISDMYISNDNLFIINDKTSEYLLNYYTWLDGSPCGIEIIYV